MIVGLGDDDQISGLFGEIFSDSGDPYERWVWTPWAVKDFAKQVDDEIFSVGADYSRAYENHIVDDDLQAAFNEFYDAWLHYYKAMPSPWLPFVASDIVKTLKGYRERLAEWAKKLTDRGVQVTTPLPGAGGPRDKTPGNTIANLTSLAITAGVVYLGYRVINDTGILKKFAGR